MPQMNINIFAKNLRKLGLKPKIFFGLIGIAYLFSVVFFWQKQDQSPVAQVNRNQQAKYVYIAKRLSDCYEQKNRSSCLKAAVEDIYKKFPLADFQSAVVENESNEPVFNTCHEASHYIGRLAYQEQKNVKNLFNACQHICLDGCYHGVVEGYFIDKNISLVEQNFKEVSNEVAKLCGKSEDYRTPELYVSCLHGLGHAVMYITDFDLPDALDLCDSLSGANERELCYTGALMANSDNRNSEEHPSKYLKDDDPMYPCPILKEKHQKKCYEYNTLTFYEFTNYDWGKTIELCGQVPSPYRSGCYQTMGGDQVGFTDDVEKIKKACSEIPSLEFQNACIDGAEANLAMRYSSNFDKPLQFCSIMEDAHKSKCFDTFTRLLNRWSRVKSEKEPICLKIKENVYKDMCLDSIN